MQPHFIVFKPSLEEYKRRINWDILDEELKALAMSFFDRYNLSDSPVAMWKICKAEKRNNECIIGGRKFSGKVFSMIEDGQDVAVYIASCGSLDNRIYSDPIESFFSDTLKREACDKAFEFCNGQIESIFGSKVCSINPGSGNPDLWPFEQIKDLFGILKNDDLPVDILSSGLLCPVKSIIGIFFAHEGNFISCQTCSKSDCPDRKTCL